MTEYVDVSTSKIVDERGHDSRVRTLRLEFLSTADGDAEEEASLLANNIPVFMGPQLPMLREWIRSISETFFHDSYRAIIAAHLTEEGSEVSEICDSAECVQAFLSSIAERFSVVGFDPYPVSIWFVPRAMEGRSSALLLEALRQSWLVSLRDLFAIELSATDDSVTIHCEQGLLATLDAHSRMSFSLLGVRLRDR